jgi:predicted Zn-dependent protease
LRGAVDRGADEGDARTGGSAPHGTAAAASGPPTPTPQQRRLRAVVWVIVGVTAAGTMIYGAYLGFVWFLGWTATQIPRSWEVQIGRSAASDILSKARVCADPRLNRFIAKMAKRLEKGMKKKPYDFHFKVLDRKPVNAFALPGGYVFIHRGLLKKAESGSEVAGVLAHEIQHVLKRHGMRRVVRSLGFMLAVRIIFGDVGGFSDLVARGAVQLGSLKYDREQEDEADMEGVKLMYRAGIDPRGLPRFFSRLAKKEAKMSDTEKTLLPILSTHPPSAERRKRILRYIEKRGLPDKIKRFDTFKEVKNLCTPMQINDPDKMPSAKRKAEKSPEQRDAQSAQ